MEAPFLQKADILNAWRERGIEPPRLYAMGFSHANCGGGCVRGGQKQWALLLRTMPERYAEWENEEEATRQMLGKDVAMLKQTKNGVSSPLTLRTLRERLQDNAEQQPSLFEGDDDGWGSCGCFTMVDEDEVSETETAVDLPGTPNE